MPLCLSVQPVAAATSALLPYHDWIVPAGSTLSRPPTIQPRAGHTTASHNSCARQSQPARSLANQPNEADKGNLGRKQERRSPLPLLSPTERYFDNLERHSRPLRGRSQLEHSFIFIARLLFPRSLFPPPHSPKVLETSPISTLRLPLPLHARSRTNSVRARVAPPSSIAQTAPLEPFPPSAPVPPPSRLPHPLRPPHLHIDCRKTTHSLIHFPSPSSTHDAP